MTPADAVVALSALTGDRIRIVVQVAGPSLLTAPQVAEIIGAKSRSTVWAWVDQGLLPAPKGRRWARADIERAIEKRAAMRSAKSKRRTV